MKKRNLLLVSFFGTLFIFQRSLSMENIRPSDPQRVIRLTDDTDQINVMTQIQGIVNTIKLIITQNNKFVDLKNLMNMGYSIGQIETACNQLGNRTATIKSEIIMEKQRQLDEQKTIQDQRRKDEERARLKRKREDERTSNEGPKKKKRKINQEQVETIIALIQDEFTTSSSGLVKTETILKRFRFMNFEDKDIMQAIIEIKKRQNSQEKAEEIKSQEKNLIPKINALFSKIKKPNLDIEILTTIIKAMTNPNITISLPIYRRINFASPQNLSGSQLLEHNFEKEDIIAACKQIGSENIPENLKKELFN